MRNKLCAIIEISAILYYVQFNQVNHSVQSAAAKTTNQSTVSSFVICFVVVTFLIFLA